MSLQTEFKQHYKTLGLPPDADWQQVQASYRQLLIRWHPDRHRHNSTLHEHATQHFIGLTTAFNELRSFQRQHNRLPLQDGSTYAAAGSADQTAHSNSSHAQVDAVATADSRVDKHAGVAIGSGNKSAPSNQRRQRRASATRTDNNPATSTVSEKEKRRAAKQPTRSTVSDTVAKPVEGVSYSTFQLSDEQLQQASLVGGSAKPGLLSQIKTLSGQRQYQMAGLIIGLMLFVILLMVVLDKTSSNSRHNEASSIVIESGVSEFVRPPDDILRGRTTNE